MDEKSLSALEQVLVDTIQKASAVTGEAIDGAKIVTGKAVDFAQEQIPDVIHQLLMWKFTQSLILFIVFLILSLFLIYWTYKIVTVDSKSDWDGCQIFSILTGFLSVAFLTGALLELDWLQIWIAPKVYLLEYVAELIN